MCLAKTRSVGTLNRNSEKASGNLNRALGLGALFVYGLGDILGAGIYAVVGKIAGAAGNLAWLSFAIALVVALLTAFSYGELCSRHPHSGGASVYVDVAFGRRWLSILTGWILFCATVLSMATLSQAFAGYIGSVGWTWPAWIAIAGFLAVLMGINLRGITHSSAANMVSTAVEVSGLLIVLVCGLWFLSQGGGEVAEAQPGDANLKGVLTGAALAFFAFTGFEDLANIAEEVKQPHRNIPRAMLMALAAAGVVYLSVSYTATAVVPAEKLGESSSPLLEVVRTSYPPFPVLVFSFIAMFAVANTTLLNYVTASRLLYGMAEQELLPRIFARVHGRFKTPYVSVLAILPVVFGLAASGTLGGLASSTSALILTVFTIVNVSLIKIKWGEHGKRAPFHVPAFLPWIAVALNVVAFFSLPRQDLIPAGLLAAGGLALTLIVLRLAPKRPA